MADSTVQAVTTLLEYWLSRTPIRTDRDARSIVFRFLTRARETWSFVPSADGPLLRPGTAESPAAVLSAHPTALLRLLLEGERDRQHPMTIEGDPTALLAIARALREANRGRNLVGIRLER